MERTSESKASDDDERRGLERVGVGRSVGTVSERSIRRLYTVQRTRALGVTRYKRRRLRDRGFGRLAARNRPTGVLIPRASDTLPSRVRDAGRHRARVRAQGGHGGREERDPTDRPTDKQRQAGRQAGRQTGRQRKNTGGLAKWGRERERERERERNGERTRKSDTEIARERDNTTTRTRG